MRFENMKSWRDSFEKKEQFGIQFFRPWNFTAVFLILPYTDAAGFVYVSDR